MAQPKVGDRYKCLTKSWASFDFHFGRVYTVIAVTPAGTGFWQVTFDNNQTAGIPRSHCWEKVEDFKTLINSKDRTDLFRYLKAYVNA